MKIPASVRPALAGFRRRVALALRVLPLPSTVIGPVKGTHRALSEWLERNGNSSGRGAGHSLTRIAPACWRTNPSPVLAIPRTPWNFLSNAQHELPAAYFGNLRWGRIATRQFEVIAPDDRLFDDLFLRVPADRHPARTLVLPFLPRARTKRGTYVTIATTRANNYYHWMIDCLPRLSLVDGRIADDFQVLIPDKPSPFHGESLTLLGIPADRQVHFGEEHWVVENLVALSLVNTVSQSSPPACAWLRGKVLSALPAPEKSLPTRIFISRALATKRRLLNEPEVIALLERHGFVSVRTETMAVADQARLFAGADIVVGPHGAGLSNVIFMRPGTLLIELVPYRRAKPCYISLAGAMGVRYACVTDAPEDAASEPAAPQKESDFSIPVSRLEKALTILERAVPAAA